MNVQLSREKNRDTSSHRSHNGKSASRRNGQATDRYSPKPTNRTKRTNAESPDERFPPPDGRELRLFRSLDVHNTGEVSAGDFITALNRVGLLPDDVRLRETMTALEQYSPQDILDKQSFCELIRPNIFLVEQALQGNLVIPDFKKFCDEIDQMFRKSIENRAGEIAHYIPQLARVNPESYGVALCTIDGQRWAVGDSNVDFSVQSSCKPINYCLALEEHGEDFVHGFVGREPSGRIFNELTLTENGKPHNSMINAGAIMSSALIRQDLDNADRFDYVLSRWRALCGEQRVGFNNAVYQSERHTADRNFALGYYMREHGAFPPDTDLLESLEFFFQCCSIEMNAATMATVAATLANGGVCPVTGDRVLQMTNVQHCLSMMSSCGMYDFSGEFAFTVGLPAKSSVSGVLLVVIPNVMGLCLWSPRLDHHGNSVRGIDFCRRLVHTFNFHNYENMTGSSDKRDPRVNHIQSKANKVNELIWAASKGDHGAVHRLVVRGFDQDAADYDHRTALHLAAAEGREQVVRYLLESGANANPKDRWGGTPLDDAIRCGNKSVVDSLEQHAAHRGESAVDASLTNAPLDERLEGRYSDSAEVVELIYAASEGDLSAIRRMVARGIDLGQADYDLRTPLHLASAEGREDVVQFFIDQQVELSPLDRWGGTPLADARRHGQLRVVQLLESQGATA